MIDYRSTTDKYEISANIKAVYDNMLTRLKPNRTREGTYTGPPSDGKTPFVDVFTETKGQPYALRLAKAVVRSWMVTEPVIFDSELIIGFPRPLRPCKEHFSYGIIRGEFEQEEAYQGRVEQISAIMKELETEMNPLSMDYLHDECKRRFDTPENPSAYDDLVERTLWWVGGYQGHTVPSYNKLLEKGIGGVLNDVTARLEKETDERKCNTLNACRIILQGMSEWILMQADAAEKKAAEGDTEKTMKRYMMIAENCRSIALDPPKTYYQAAQLVWFYSLWDSMDCLGRTDQYLYRFFEKSLECDRQFTEDITACLMMKFFEHGIHNITVGGVKPDDGSDAANDLSFLLLQILRFFHDTHPRMTVRISEKTDPLLLSLVVKMWSEGMSDPTVASDTVIIPAFVKNYGVAPEDARDYTALGCQELEIPGKSNFGCEDGVINLAKILELTLNDGRSRYDNSTQIGLKTGHITDYDDFESLWEAYMSQVRYFTKHFCELCNMGQEIRAANYAKLVKTPFTDACIERGLNLDEGGAVYNLGCVETAGTSVVADSLTAIKTLVFDKKLISPETLKKALAANFENYEYERQLLLNHAPKFGNDNAAADEMAQRVIESFWLEIKKYKSVRGGEFTGACSLLSGGVGYGRRTWATPDGRFAGEPLSNTIGPRPGTDKNGLTAMLNSCAKLPLEYGVGGTTCNITIPVSITKTPEMRKNIESLIYTYLTTGGQMGQVTTACVEDLIDAKKNPGAHQGLIVRIGGFSIRFCEISEEEQDELISRYS